MRHRQTMRTSVGTLGLLLLACGTDDDNGEAMPPRVAISSQSAALTAQQNTERALRGVLDAAEFLTESATLADGLSSLSASGTSTDCSAAQGPCATDDPSCEAAFPTDDCAPSTDDGVTTEDLAEAHDELREAIEELVSFLREEIFIESNLESETETHATYLIPAAVFCGTEGSSSLDPVAPPGGAGSDMLIPAPAPVSDDEPSCEDEVAKLQPRLRLSSPGEGDVDVELLLTEEKHNPITFQLYDDRIGMVTDLGEFAAAVEAAGEELDGIETLDGEVGIELVRNNATSYSLRYNVLRDLVVSVGEPGNEFELMMAKSTPALEVELNGTTRSVTGTLSYGAINLVAPLASFMNDTDYDEFGEPLPAKTYTGVIDAVLGGLNGSFTYDGPTDVLALDGLGLGDVTTTVKHNGNTLLSLDVNPDDRRRFDLSISSSGDGAQLTFSPTLDVRLGLHFAHIQDQIDDLPGAFLDDTLRLWFEGPDPTVELLDGSVRVVSGTLHLDSTADGAGVTVEAGMCLLEASDDENDEASTPDSIASAFTAGMCDAASSVE